MVDELLPAAERFYLEIQEKLGAKLLHKSDILRIFASIEEQNNWSSLEGDERFDTYLKNTGEDLPESIAAPFGYGQVKTIGHLDTAKFLDESHTYFEQQGIRFERTKLNYDEIKADSNYIFCEGFFVKNNPWFSYLPLKPAHGEVLIIESEDLDIKDVLNKNLFVQPLGNHRYKIGSTHNWEPKDVAVSKEGKEDILQRFSNFVKVDFEIVEEAAGIRPTVSDRRPLLGTHSIDTNVHIFNGLGTKGVMLAPYFAAHFLDFLLDKVELIAEVNIERFDKGFEQY